MPDDAEDVIEHCQHLSHKHEVHEGFIVLDDVFLLSNGDIEALSPPFLPLYPCEDESTNKGYAAVSNAVAYSKEESSYIILL